MLMKDGVYTYIVRLAEMNSTYRSEHVWTSANSLHKLIANYHQDKAILDSLSSYDLKPYSRG